MTTPENPDSPETTQLDTAALKKPDEKLDEATPIGDEVKRELEALEIEDDDDDEDADGDAPFIAKSYKIDVKRALERETQDGKGDEDPGESDFVSFATDEVHKED